jgi:hypothetical protein
MIGKRFKVLAGMVLLASAGMLSLTTQHARAQQQWGWYIAINNGRTETNSISFAVGSSQNDPNKWTYTWRRGEPTTFFVGPQVVHNGQVYVNAAVGDHGKNGWFCVDYQDATGNRRGVKHWDFDDSEDHNLNTGDRDGECGN